MRYLHRVGSDEVNAGSPSIIATNRLFGCAGHAE
jgi:hypothetical protein